MSEIPQLPNDQWCWGALVDASGVEVSLYLDDVAIAKRRIGCTDPQLWEGYIKSMAETIWEDLNSTARLSAKLGIPVIYE